MSSRKKRRLDVENAVEGPFADVIAEVDLEISLRERLAETLQSRIAWALILQESLQGGTTLRFSVIVSQETLMKIGLAPRHPSGTQQLTRFP